MAATLRADRGRRRFFRLSLLLQALGLLLAIGLTVPDFVQSRLHPQYCWICIDVPGIVFMLSLVIYGPVALLLILLAWRWRGQRRWPLVMVGVVDAIAVAWAALWVIGFVQSRHDTVPTAASIPPLLVLPALATLALAVNLVWPLPWKSLLGASAVGSLLLGVFLWFYAIRPVTQRIPGELSLPFSATIVYEGKDLGCREHVQGWVRVHTCTVTTLVVYRGSGDPVQDQRTINNVLLAQHRLRAGEERVLPLPVDLAVNRSYGESVDPRNAGLCLIITDRITPAPASPPYASCGYPADYADIRSHWPSDGDTYAIGIIYDYTRPDYLR
jgi:hypothetical protein